MRRLIGLYTVIAVIIASAGSFAPMRQSDWSQWLGPHRDGVTQESSGYPKGWPPKVLWRAKVGYGISSPLIVRDRVYTVGWSKNNGDRVMCLNAATGKTIWSQSYPSPPYTRKGAAHPDTYKGVMATPAFDLASGMLYTLSCDGLLCCWNTNHGGKRRWSVSLSDKYHIQDVKPEFNGFVPSPLLYGRWVIIEAGAAEGNLLAFDKRTGALQWVSASKDAMGVGSPTVMKVDGVPCVAAITRQSFLVVRMDKGHLGDTLLEYPWPSHYAENSPSPVVDGNRVFITMCESSGRRTALLSIGLELPGHVRVDYTTTDFFTCTSTAVLFQGYLYFLSGRRLQCVDMVSGKVMWSSPKIFVENSGFGSEVGNLLVTGDSKLLIWDGDRGGDLVLADASPTAPYHELARIKGIIPTGTCYPMVALGGGRIVCRNDVGDIVCLSVVVR